MSERNCFNVWILGNELLSRCIVIWSLMHYEHNNYIQSKHKCLINYEAWIEQWFAESCAFAEDIFVIMGWAKLPDSYF